MTTYEVWEIEYNGHGAAMLCDLRHQSNDLLDARRVYDAVRANEPEQLFGLLNTISETFEVRMMPKGGRP